jgi:hypothetical protein
LARGLTPLADRSAAPRRSATSEDDGARTGIRLITRDRYVGSIALVAVLITLGAAVADYVLKTQATATFTDGRSLLRFFAWFYTLASLLAFVVQSALHRVSLERLGPARTASLHPLGFAITSAAALALPGLVTAAINRGIESILRNSLYRSGYELLFTPIPSREKRTVKGIIDVGCDRLGDALGGGLILLVLALAPGGAVSLLCGATLVLALAAFLIARRLQVGYVRTLERNLVRRAVELELDDLRDNESRTILLHTIGSSGATDLREHLRAARAAAKADDETQAIVPPAAATRSHDPVVAALEDLRSGSVERIRARLTQPAIDRVLAPQIIALLAMDDVADAAVRALRLLGDPIAGQLADALADPTQDFAVRRRVPRVLAMLSSERAIHGLVDGLSDARFEVRYQCGRALSRVHTRDSGRAIPADRIWSAVLREVQVDRAVWKGQRLLERGDDRDDAPFVDAFLRNRSNRSMEHLFTILSLVLPMQPLQIAYRGLLTDDEALRGTALEYLESILPSQVREAIWPFLEDTRGQHHPARPREEVLDELLRSNQSIEINLADLREARRAGGQEGAS